MVLILDYSLKQHFQSAFEGYFDHASHIWKKMFDQFDRLQTQSNNRDEVAKMALLS